MLVSGLVVMMSLPGCGEPELPLAAVEGIVTLDNKPLANVEVQFSPDPDQKCEGPRSTGVTDENGHFKLQCDDQREGAVLGKHRVTVRDLKSYGASIVRVDKHSADYGSAAEPPRPRARFPDQFADLSRSPLRAEVGPEQKPITLQLSSKP